jgi:hypothetical protein
MASSLYLHYNALLIAMHDELVVTLNNCWVSVLIHSVFFTYSLRGVEKSRVDVTL